MDIREQTLERQLEFVEWLKKNEMYNQWSSAQEMQAMHNVWDISQQEIERLKGEGWISVDERLPVDGRYVLCIYKQNLSFIAMYHNGDYKTFHDEVTRPTHWQPLPKAPEVG